MQIQSMWIVEENYDKLNRPNSGHCSAFTTHEEATQYISELLHGGAYNLKIERRDIS
jgi:hypothetical protein